jgi:tripartite-type tricarboxylate transporter receptor subunit TctC
MRLARFLALLLWGVALVSQAQPYPSRPVRIIAPFSPGTATDILARQLAAGLTQELGQPVAVENRPGGAAIIGTEAVAKSPPDGYTILLGSSQSHATNSSLIRKLPYDPIADFAPIARISVFPAVLVVHQSIPAKTVSELVAYAKQRPGQINYASTGPGTQAHLQAAMLAATSGIVLTHVPFKEAGQAFSSLIRGDLQMMFYPHSALGAVLQSGRVTVLASTGEKRSPRTPDTPTMIEAGYPEVTLAAWNALYAPAGTPRAVIDTLNRATGRVLQDVTTRAKFTELGIEIAFSSPDEAAAFTRAEIERYRRLVAMTNLKIE